MTPSELMMLEDALATKNPEIANEIYNAIEDNQTDMDEIYRAVLRVVVKYFVKPMV